jgi:two-component system, NtrC family, response regulator HydG
MAQVLLVDDEPDFVSAVIEMLRMHEHAVETADTLLGARNRLAQATPDVLLLDLMLPDGNGLELLQELEGSDLKRVVLITGHPGIKSHIKSLSGPSVSYLTKPIDSSELVELLDELDHVGSDGAKAATSSALHFGLIVGETPVMHRIYEQIEKVARTDTPVLVVGETGTGKELVAESIHRASERTGEFVAVNCGSLSKDLAGSELFGHEKGSFTGAVRRHFGFFKRADSGTLFLDELTEMPMELQPHFLRVVETHKVLPVGSEKEQLVDARIVAATNREPNKAIADRLLRQDLYYRLSVVPISVPPLRPRRSDIPLMVDYFLAQFRQPGDSRTFSEKDLKRLEAYQWPGNVRELRHVVQRSYILSDPDAISLELPERFESPFNPQSAPQGIEIGRSIREVERELIERTLSHFDGDKKATADTLGISLNTLYNRLNAYQEGQNP